MNRIALTSIIAVTTAATSAAQSAAVNLSGPGSVYPGDTISVSILVDHNTDGAALGVFGTPGLFGLGGEASTSSTSADASSVVLASELSFGSVAQNGPSPLLATVAGGTGVSDGLSTSPLAAATFDVTIDPDTNDATIDIGFTGTVVLVEGDRLVSYSTTPGTTQSLLTVNDLSIEVLTFCTADTNRDGQVTPADFNAWILAFNNLALECDQNGDGLCTPADFNAWILNFNQGC